MRRNTCFLNFSCSHIQWILLLMLMLVVIASMKIDLMSRLSSVDRDSRVEEISSGSSHMYSSLDLRLHRHWDSHWELLSFTFIWGWTCSYFSPGLDPASRRSEDLVLISFFSCFAPFHSPCLESALANHPLSAYYSLVKMWQHLVGAILLILTISLLRGSLR